MRFVGDANCTVSVPLRGLDMWKLKKAYLSQAKIHVSVPLRGLDMWKLEYMQWEKWMDLAVSVPLRGLDMWKLKVLKITMNLSNGFSPLAGIRYVETSLAPLHKRANERFQSPCGD